MQRTTGRRGLLALGTLLLAAALPLQAIAQAADTTTVIVPFPAGGTLDVLARVLTQKLGDSTRQAFIVDNRPGANGMIGAKFVARSKPDGRTWGMFDLAPFAINPYLYPPDPQFSAEKDLRPVRALASQPLVLVVPAKSTVKGLKEFLDLARKQDVTYASGGIGSSGHLTMSYLSNRAGGLKFTHVPYKGGPQVLNALLAGEVDSGFIIIPNVLQQINRGQLVPLAVSSATRSAHLPNVPTMIELGFQGFEVENRFFAWLPAGVPEDVAKRIDGMLVEALKDPVVLERLKATGLDPITDMGEAESRKWLLANRDLWQKVIRDNNIKAE